MNIDIIKESICPTCGMLLGTSHLVQLNITLRQLLEAEGIPVATIGTLVEAVTNQILLVSKTIAAHPVVITENKNP